MASMRCSLRRSPARSPTCRQMGTNTLFSVQVLILTLCCSKLAGGVMSTQDYEVAQLTEDQDLVCSDAHDPQMFRLVGTTASDLFQRKFATVVVESADATTNDTILLLGGYAAKTGQPSSLVTRSDDLGRTFRTVTRKGDFPPRFGAGAASLPDRSVLLLGGGWNFEINSVVYRSTDYGLHWSSLPRSPWPGRYDPGVAVLRQTGGDAVVVLVGGVAHVGTKADIWLGHVTGEGATWSISWSEVTGTEITPRAGATLVSFAAGVGCPAPSGTVGASGSIVISIYEDVWCGHNAATDWVLVSNKLSFTAGTAVAVHDAGATQIVAGGFVDGSTDRLTMFASSDYGVHWTQVVASPPWPPRIQNFPGGLAVVTSPPGGKTLAQRILLIAGDGPNINIYRDVWESVPCREAAGVGHTSQGTCAPCDAGFYANGSLPRRWARCTPCAPGAYCSVRGATRPTGICQKGQWCGGGASPPLPCDPGTFGNTTSLFASNCSGPCPPGSFCKPGSVTPMPCPAGRFGADWAMASDSCSGVCPAGYVCPSGSVAATSKCPIGFYCRAGTGPKSGQHPCPAGTFGNASGLGSEDQCRPCPAGQTTNHSGAQHASACVAASNLDNLSLETASVVLGGIFLAWVVLRVVSWAFDRRLRHQHKIYQDYTSLLWAALSVAHLFADVLWLREATFGKSVGGPSAPWVLTFACATAVSLLASASWTAHTLRKEAHENEAFREWLNHHVKIAAGVAVLSVVKLGSLRLLVCGAFGARSMSAPLRDRTLAQLHLVASVIGFLEDVPQLLSAVVVGQQTGHLQRLDFAATLLASSVSLSVQVATLLLSGLVLQYTRESGDLTSRLARSDILFNKEPSILDDTILAGVERVDEAEVTRILQRPARSDVSTTRGGRSSASARTLVQHVAVAIFVSTMYMPGVARAALSNSAILRASDAESCSATGATFFTKLPNNTGRPMSEFAVVVVPSDNVAQPDVVVELAGRCLTCFYVQERYVYVSTDGGETFALKTGAPWPTRSDPAAVVLQDRSILLFGGNEKPKMTDADHLLRDVWRTTDLATTWTRVSAAAEWPARHQHAAAALGDVVVLVGGVTSAGPVSDIWASSDDGKHWVKVKGPVDYPITRPSFLPLTAQESCSSQAGSTPSALLLGGSSTNADVWCVSHAGHNWTKIADTVPFGPRVGFGAVMLRDEPRRSSPQLVVLGGSGGTPPGPALAYGFHSDVWSSFDFGRTWNRVTDAAAFQELAFLGVAAVTVPSPSESRTQRIVIFYGRSPWQGYMPHSLTNLPCPDQDGVGHATDGSCAPCKPGTYANRSQPRHWVRCLPSPRGTYTNDSQASQPSGVCPSGTFCELGASRPIAYPSGRYGAQPGLGTADCTAECPVGHYCPAGASAPLPCPAGTYGASLGLRTPNSCGLCHAGFECPPASNMSQMDPCPPGYYCPPGTKPGHAIACKVGTYNGNTSAALESNCLRCPAGKTTTVTAATTVTSCCDSSRLGEAAVGTVALIVGSLTVSWVLLWRLGDAQSRKLRKLRQGNSEGRLLRRDYTTLQSAVLSVVHLGSDLLWLKEALLCFTLESSSAPNVLVFAGSTALSITVSTAWTARTVVHEARSNKEFRAWLRVNMLSTSIIAVLGAIKLRTLRLLVCGAFGARAMQAPVRQRTLAHLQLVGSLIGILEDGPQLVSAAILAAQDVSFQRVDVIATLTASGLSLGIELATILLSGLVLKYLRDARSHDGDGIRQISLLSVSHVHLASRHWTDSALGSLVGLRLEPERAAGDRTTQMSALRLAGQRDPSTESRTDYTRM